VRKRHGYLGQAYLCRCSVTRQYAGSRGEVAAGARAGDRALPGGAIIAEGIWRSDGLSHARAEWPHVLH
jgi:hypothetical protein